MANLYSREQQSQLYVLAPSPITLVKSLTILQLRNNNPSMWLAVRINDDIEQDLHFFVQESTDFEPI